MVAPISDATARRPASGGERRCASPVPSDCARTAANVSREGDTTRTFMSRVICSCGVIASWRRSSRSTSSVVNNSPSKGRPDMSADVSSTRRIMDLLARGARPRRAAGEPEDSVYGVDRPFGGALVRGLHERLPAFVQGELRLRADDEHDAHVLDRIARLPEAFRGGSEIHSALLLQGGDERRRGPARHQEVVRQRTTSTGLAAVSMACVVASIPATIAGTSILAP